MDRLGSLEIPETERLIKQAFDAGRRREAMEQAVRLYGPEILGYIASVLRDEDWARDVFARLCEDLWAGFDRFEWRSSFRTWAYRAARNAVVRARTRDRRPVRLDTRELDALPDVPRSTTRPHLRTENKLWLACFRDSLDPDEQTLLTLRIDRDLSWTDVALVLHGEQVLDDLPRATAQLRKRFERLKERLRRAAIEARSEER